MLFSTRWFLDRPLTSKLVLVLSVPVLLVLAITVGSLWAFRDFEKAEELAQRSGHIRSQAIYYLDVLNSLQNEFRGFLLTGDRSFVIRYDEAKGDLDLAGIELAKLVQSSPSQAQRDRVANVQAIARRLIEEKEWIIDRMEAGFSKDGIEYIRSGRGRALADAMSSRLGELDKESARILRDRLQDVAAKRAMLLEVIVGGSIVALLLTMLGAMIVARSITIPLATLAKAAGEIGESGHAAFPDAGRQDEVGVLSRNMDDMQRRLVPAERLATLTRMATSIAHDLRTPLLGLERGLQGLQYTADALSPEGRRLLGDLHAGARLAVGIVQDILDLYRQAYGELPLSYSRFALGEVVGEAVDLMRAEVGDRRLSVTVEMPSVIVSADQRRLLRVMVNLLENAVKNSPSGGRLWIKGSLQGDGAAPRVRVAVEDEGRGLEPEALETLFEPNRPALVPTRSGTGLGLYLCRLVIGAHRGTLAAHNRPEGGACFVFEIPVEVHHVDPTSDSGRPAAVPAEPAHRS